MTNGVEAEAQPRAAWSDYMALARPGHWVKHVFIVPGVALALLLRPQPLAAVAMRVALGFLSAALVASANYVLNEWLDAEADAHHRSKAVRPAVAKRLFGPLVWCEYATLVAVGLALALQVSRHYALISLLFLASGVVYNVRPLRTKELPFVDVLSESINNPIRLTLGWVMVDPTSLPPGSLLLAYWMGGAFLMALKRLAEYRSARDSDSLPSLVRYRSSFRAYSEESLLLSSFLYALLAAFFLAVFLIKYRVEYLLSMPIFATLFVSYLRIALKKDSRAQAPEQLFREPALVILVSILAVALATLTVIDLPVLERLSDPHYIEIPLD